MQAPYKLYLRSILVQGIELYKNLRVSMLFLSHFGMNKVNGTMLAILASVHTH